jgi:hypothetical protein
VIGQFYRNGERISGADEHERGRTRAVLGCVRQSNYRTNHSASGAAVILWALYLAAVVYPDDDSLLASLKSIELRDTNQKSTLNLTAKLSLLLIESHLYTENRSPGIFKAAEASPTARGFLSIALSAATAQRGAVSLHFILGLTL